MPSRFKEIDLFFLGGKPGKLRVFQNEVEREQPPEQDDGVCLPAVSEVLNPQLAVNLLAENAAGLGAAGKDPPLPRTAIEVRGQTQGGLAAIHGT